jgi:hypothetical protein
LVRAVCNSARRRSWLGLDLRLVEEGEQPIVIALRDGIVLVVVALGAFERRAEPHGSDRVDAVEDLVDAMLLLVGAGLDVDRRAAVEAGREALVERRAGQQVAGELLQGEAVEGQVGVERAHDPIAIGPQFAEAVALKAVRVGVPGQVEPGPRPALAVWRRRQETLDPPLVGVGPRPCHGRRGSRSQPNSTPASARQSKGCRHPNPGPGRLPSSSIVRPMPVFPKREN